ncbi:hypothetical protein [Paraburkholderia phenoliruptrix]|uniref:hypothetical protein n=1 Tax=Paraburkholderia phenoliruptrix TaxID=252970 RepID=UPI003F64A32F
MLLIAYLVYRRNGLALLLYALVVIGTLIWAIAEVGFDFWELARRTDVLVVFGIWLLLPFVYHLFATQARPGAVTMAVCLVLTGVALAYAAFHDPQEKNGVLNASASAAAPAPHADADNWTAYGRTQAGTRYSPLAQINLQNVKNLQLACILLPVNDGHLFELDAKTGRRA